MLALNAATASAQSFAKVGGGDKMDQAAIERSWTMQAELAKIDANREGFIDQLVAEWAAVADPTLYSNLGEELRPLMRAATSWQLYAASLVGDYRSVQQVVTGKASPASYVNALGGVAQPKAARMMGPFAVGAAASSLVFTPIAPCRIMDTRNSGARTGIIVPGSPRTVDMTTAAFSKGQGGDLSCVGLPSYSDYAWSANVTVVGFSGGNGALVAYPFGDSAPNTSIINYYPGPFAIANSSTFTGCLGCTDDIVLSALGVGTHVIVDIMGYFEQAVSSAGNTITLLAGTSTNIAGGGYSVVSGGACPGGTQVIGGAQTNTGLAGNTLLTSDHNITGNSLWYELIKNTGTSTASATVFSICQDIHIP